MTDNYILTGAERQAELEVAKAAFFASGGRVVELETYRAAPLPPRGNRVDPETVLVRKRRQPRSTDRSQLRRSMEAP
ncbi:hypothetical protein LU688_16515 [Pseudomonas soli]|uniref:hypothetical protein n=1 Tax=Pseudomonas soli TaxID=1306993 RepID=UPI001E538918|nr:hypothetical protein [Pseudomonas soli]WJO19892.1 hypothetical protein LU688_16515 [Pseudomonas soli]